MRIGIVGAGHIGGNAARLFARAGHEVMVSFSRDEEKLDRLAADIGGRTGTPAEAVAFGEVVVFSVPWRLVDKALKEAGDLAGKIVIDTTNQFGRSGIESLAPDSAARHNAGKAPGALWVKAFNTLTAAFQGSAAGRSGPDRVVIFYATDQDTVTPVVDKLINDAGFDPVRSGTLDRNDVGHQEPKGDLYGEEFHHDEAKVLVDDLRGTPPSGHGRP